MTWEPLVFPAWAEWHQRKGIQLGHPGDDRTRCRWCAEPLTGRRTSWCSNACSYNYGRVWSWGAVRKYVYHRERGICARCQLPIDGRWEVDHIIRVTDGGTDDPANLRLLDEACHVAVGYEQRAAARAVGQEVLALEGTRG